MRKEREIGKRIVIPAGLRRPGAARLKRFSLTFWPILWIAATILPVGCRSTAPMRLWRPAVIDTPRQSRVVLTGLQGPEELTEPLREALLRQPGLPLVDYATLQPSSPLRLVSAGGQRPSDLAIAAAARSGDFTYLLSGEIIQQTQVRRDQGSPSRRRPNTKWALAWRLTPLGEGEVINAPVISLTPTRVDRQHPDLAALIDPQQKLLAAAAMETRGVLRPSLELCHATLAQPRWSLGSAAVRRGNRLAQQADWPAAEKAYVAVTEQHPSNPAAWINAAIAAVARQDYLTAKRRIDEAIGRSWLSPADRGLAEETLVWIELAQRREHDSFGLPDPPGGWRVLANTLP